VGCLILAEHDLVFVKDPTKAKHVTTEFKARPSRKPRGQHVNKTTDDAPPPQDQQAGAPATETPSARRATSLEPPTRFSPPPILPTGFGDDNYWARAGCEYFDGDEVPSDPDDGQDFVHDWADVPASDEPAAEEYKSNAEFSNYIITASARRTTAKHVSAALTSVAN
jgi:hypothetical protein